MSKVLKFVVLERENPLQLKEPYNPIKKVNENTINNYDLSRRKYFEDESRQLLDEAVTKAREIIEKSKDDAERLISKAHAEKEKIEKKAFDKGYKNGVEAGKKEQEVLWNKYLIELNKTKQEIKEQNTVFKQHLEKECLKLSLAIAEKILGKAIQIDSEYFLELIKKSIKEAGEEKEALIRISEADYDKVSPVVSQLKNGQNCITLLKDPTLSTGDCIITGPNYEIDAGIHTQVENIAEILRKLEVI